jgi:hypothetical protein
MKTLWRSIAGTLFECARWPFGSECGWGEISAWQWDGLSYTHAPLWPSVPPQSDSQILDRRLTLECRFDYLWT